LDFRIRPAHVFYVRCAGFTACPSVQILKSFGYRVGKIKMMLPKPWRENELSFGLSLLSLCVFHPTETEKIEKSDDSSVLMFLSWRLFFRVKRRKISPFYAIPWTGIRNWKISTP